MRLIDADILKDAFKDKEGNEFTAFHFYEAIEKAPTIDSLGSWIPVEERLPEEEDYRHCYGLPDGCVMWQTDNGDIGFGWYYHSTKCWSDIYDNHIKTGKVIAWMPLPKPYEVKNNEV